MPQALAPRWAAHKSRYGSIPAPFHVSSGSAGGLPQDPALIPVCWLTQPLTLRLDRPFNYAEVGQVDGSTARYTAPGATVIYPFFATLTTAVDADPSNLAHWTVTYNSTPRMRSPSLTINLLHRTDDEKAFLLGIGRNRRIRLTGLPNEWPTGADTLVVRGIQHQATTYARTVTWETGALIGTLTPGGLLLTGTTGNYASTPDDVALDIVGDIDLRADVTMPDWTVVGGYQTLVHKWDEAANQSYGLALLDTGALRIIWTTGGSNATLLTMDSTVSVSYANGVRGAVRATLDVDNGAAGRTARFYTAQGVNGPWTQLGADVVAGGTTSIFNGTGVLEIGTYDNGLVVAGSTSMKVHAAQVRSSIDGTVVANPNFSAQLAGTTSFTDSATRAWTVNGAAQITPSTLVSGPWFRWGTSYWSGIDTRPF